MEVETVGGLIGLVHADCPFEDWHEMQRLPWSLIEPTGSIGAGFLRSDERYTRGYGTVVRNVRAVVHGHQIRRSPRVLGNVHYIDTGGWRMGGHFTFLELSELELIAGPRPKQSEQSAQINQYESDVWQCSVTAWPP